MCAHLRNRLHIVKKSTIHDIAKSLNITASTVSRALNDHPRISEETKRIVRAAAKKAGYRMNGVASALRSGRTYILGMIVPTTNRSFFSAVIRGVEEEANKAGYNVMICQSSENYQTEIKNINALLRAQVDGIVVSIAKETTDFQHFTALKEQGVPLFFFDRVIYDGSASTVVIDDYRGAYKAVEHLIEQGCRRIAAISSNHRQLNIYRERLRGYREALLANGLQSPDEYIIFGELDIEAGKNGAAQLWKLPEPPEAIFCASDFSALGAMQYLKEKGLRVPTDVALAGFANEPFTAFVEPAMTTVDQRPLDMGQTIARLFLEQVEADHEPFLSKNITLNAELIIRRSSLWKQ